MDKRELDIWNIELVPVNIVYRCFLFTMKMFFLKIMPLFYTFSMISEPYVTEEELKLMLRGAELSGAIEEEEQVLE